MAEREAQLHELLAAEQDLRGQANKILLETKQVFGKPELFKGSVTSYTPFVDSVENPPEEVREEVGTTVPKRLEYTIQTLAPYYDAVFQKEATNQLARADIVCEGKVLATGVPATVLLGLESKLVQLRTSIESMPTLDVKTAWENAPGQEAGVYVAKHDEVKLRTKKVTKPLVLSPSTQFQQAIVKEVTEDINVGTLRRKYFSGAVTSARASEILGRLDTLLRAVKAARQRANQAPVVTGNIGRSLLGFILQ